MATSPTPLPIPKKLQMKAGQRAALLHVPEGYLERLTPLPEGVELTASAEEPGDFVLLFVKNRADLQRLLPSAMQALKHDALLWIAYPKGGAKAGTDLNRDLLWAAVADYQLTGVSLVALDEVWSAMRFRPTEAIGK